LAASCWAASTEVVMWFANQSGSPAAVSPATELEIKPRRDKPELKGDIAFQEGEGGCRVG